MILASILFIFLHFFEEFGFPGGFTWVAIKVELKLEEDDATKWELNSLSTWFGNRWFALAVYILSLLLPGVKFLTLMVFLFVFAELLMHGIFFPVSLKKNYTPGLATTVIGLVPLSLVLFSQTSIDFTWLDFLLAIVWIGLNYWFAFQSPIYKALGKQSDSYAFSKEEVYRAKPYMK